MAVDPDSIAASVEGPAVEGRVGEVMVHSRFLFFTNGLGIKFGLDGRLDIFLLSYGQEVILALTSVRTF